MWDYTEKVIEHFRNPRNVGEIKDPDGVGQVGSLACGDALKLAFKLDAEGRIAEVKFKTFGCASAIAASSALTEIVKGMTPKEAEKVTNRDIAEFLGGLPEQKMHCSVMGREALEAAIRNYRTGAESTAELEGRVVCTCFGVTENEIERVARENHLSTVQQVTNYCKAGGGCGKCHDEIAEIIARVRGGEAPQTAPPRPRQKMTNIQRIQLIQETIENDIRPALRRDGGDIELIDVQGKTALVSFRGACAQCPASDFTARELVEGRLRERVSEEIKVEEVVP